MRRRSRSHRRQRSRRRPPRILTHSPPPKKRKADGDPTGPSSTEDAFAVGTTPKSGAKGGQLQIIAAPAKAQSKGLPDAGPVLKRARVETRKRAAPDDSISDETDQDVAARRKRNKGS